MNRLRKAWNDEGQESAYLYNGFYRGWRVGFMRRINIRKQMIFLIVSIFVLLFSGIVAYKNYNQYWNIDNVYGKWKVTRLIGAYKGTKGDMPYGSNVGRSFIITNENIIDSTTRQYAIEESAEQRCFNMKVLCQTENVFDVSKQNSLKKFQMNNGIVLWSSGITDSIISQYVFYSADNEFSDQNINYCMASEFEVFSYKQDDRDKLIIELPMGYYLLERFKKQKRNNIPYGLWMVENLISRGQGEKYGIDFYDYYGKCFEIAEDYIIDDEKTKTEINWEKGMVSKDDFEKEYGIYEGLGLENDELEIWYGKGSNNYAIQLIPIDHDEIIMPLEGQWFLLTKVIQYEEPVEKCEEILRGDWKITQLIGIKDVNPDMEIWGRSDYKTWWYTQSVTFNVDMYAENAVTDWEIRKYDAKTFFQEFNVPENLIHMFGDDDILHIGMRKVYDVDEIYILISEDTLIRGRNGLWYKLERML